MIKLLIMLVFALPAVSVATPVYPVKQNTCSQLNRVLDAQGFVVLKYRFLGLRGTHYSYPSACKYWQRTSTGRVRAADGWCTVGFTCHNRNDHVGRDDDDDDNRSRRRGHGLRRYNQNRDRDSNRTRDRDRVRNRN